MKNEQNYKDLLFPSHTKVGIVYSRFNIDVTEKLLVGATETLIQAGAAKDCLIIKEVPGAVELPLIAKHLITHFSVDGVIVLGAVIRGDTEHFKYVCEMCAQGVMSVQLSHHKPVIFGLLTTDTKEQALERCENEHNKGIDSAKTLIEMLHLVR